MSLDIGEAFGRGIDRIASPAAGTLVGVLFVVQLVSSSAMKTMLAPTLATLPNARTFPGVTLPGGPAVGLLLYVAATLVALAVYVVTARVGVAGYTDSIPEEAYSRRMGAATAHTLVALIVVSVLVAIGTALLVVPGLFLATSFAFTLFYVAVEDDGAIAAMKHSWNLAADDRLRVFLVLLLAGVVAGVPSALVTSLAGMSLVGWLVSTVVAATTYVYAILVLADAYEQLRGDVGGNGVDTDPAAAPA